MSLEVRGIDHQPLRRAGIGGEMGEDAGEHAKPAPADGTVVQRFVRAVAAWRIFPLQGVADDVDDSADHPSIIHPAQPARAWKQWRKAAHLSHRQQG